MQEHVHSILKRNDMNNECVRITDKKGLYACPMHPEIQKDEPGKCPICGTDLVKQDQESGTEDN
jgi:hypothetical protein